MGANDAANMFGTAVGSRMVKFRTATLLIAVFVVAGAVIQGRAGIETVQGLASQTLRTAMICSFAAAVTVTAMSALKVPVSCSQMLVAAVIGLGLARGEVHWGPLMKVVVCWVTSPIMAMVLAVALYRLFAWVLRLVRPSIFTLDPLLRLGLIACGAYGAYALGANGVAIACAVFVGEEDWMLTPALGALLGGISIGVGALMYSRPVMMTVGRGLMMLDGFTAFVAVLSLALTVHVFALVGVPVSTSQAIVGALLGIGFVKGWHVVNLRALGQVVAWWLVSPIVAAAAAAGAYMALA